MMKNLCCDVLSELDNIGFDKSYSSVAADKYKFKNLKIFKLSIAQANILKQIAISVGADCAVHRETITAKVDFTDCILGASYSQFKKIAQKLRKQPFKLQKLADLIDENIDFELSPILIKNSLFDFKRTYLIGVLNLTSDSFSDGGSFFELPDAIQQLKKLINDGADIVELGAESTKPFSKPVSDEMQLAKLLPILNFIKESNIQIPISIDTRSAYVAKICAENGADIINDISGFDYDKDIIRSIADTNSFVVIQHSLSSPETMQENPQYKNLIDEIYFKLSEKIDLAVNAGIDRKKIIVDMGIGFGKTKEHNLEIINRIDDFKSLNVPVMLGVSRKSFLGLQNETNEIKDIYTLAINSKLIDKGVNFLRVHNVHLHKKLLSLIL